MPRAKRDLILNADDEPRTITLDISKLKPAALTLMDTLDIADVSGISHTKFTYILQAGSERDKALLMYAMAWVFARRVEPGITFDEIKACNLKIIGERPSREELASDSQRARTLVNVARTAGVAPEVAGQMTMAEVAALAPERRRRRA